MTPYLSGLFHALQTWRFSVTRIMLVSTVVVGIIVWFVTDKIQSEEFSTILHSQLSERFTKHADEERVSFIQHIQAHHQAVKLLAGTIDMHRYINRNGGRLSGNYNRAIKFHKEIPEWLPRLSVFKELVYPRYVLLLNNYKRVREVYIGSEELPPDEITNPDDDLLQASYRKSFLTMINGAPYLIASDFINHPDSSKQAILMLVSPLDSKFLARSSKSRGGDSIIALVNGDNPQLLVSSNPDLIPAGTHINGLNGRYLSKGHGLLDYESNLPLGFVSFISTDEIKQLTSEILNKERKSRAMVSIAYIASFSLLILWITGRIQKLTNKVVDFSENMDIWQPEYNQGDQIDILEDRFNFFANAIKEETEALEYQALHDNLTELPNRKCLNNRIQLEIIKGKSLGKHFTFILGDLNCFKEVNDTLGHHIGDLVIQQVAERLFHTFRKSDVVARLGGDEFGILLPDTSIEEAVLILDKVVDAFEIPFVVEQHYFTLGISLGLVEYPAHGDDVNILLKRADVAMYNAKNINSLYTVYDYAEDHHSVGRLALSQDLRKAIEQEKLEVYYQSKVDIQSDQITSAEALLRWNHPERGFIPPDEFIPLAEQTGLIKPLTEWVLEQALSQLARWHAKGLNISMAINISPCCLHDVKLPNIVRNLIKKYSIRPEDCILELTETAIMTNPMKAREILTEIDLMGVVISIDDFGTGYSSLAYLKQLPVEELKIDRSFIMEMSKDESDAIIVQATVTMAHNLGLKVVAEGVEDEETWELLKALKCDTAQGFYKDRPMPAEDFFDMVMSKKVKRQLS